MTEVSGQVDEAAGPVGTVDEFPYSAIPSGWYPVLFSGELKPGDVKSLRYFATDLVAYRGEDGTAVVMDAHCPHLGAHLGFGGTVEGCDIVCPFHGWKWAPDGRNLDVPSEGVATDRRRIKIWNVREINQTVLVWFDALGREPWVELPPEVSNTRDFLPVWPGCAHRVHNVHIRPQWVHENTVDLDHIKWVHRNDSPAEMSKMEAQGTVFQSDLSWIAGYGREKTWLTPDGPVEYVANNMLYGPGINVTRWVNSPDNSILITGTTPIDAEHSDLYHTILVEQDMQAEGAEGDLPVGRALRRVQEQIKQQARDIPIWEHLKYLDKPAYTRAEGKAFVAMRRWLAQFYPY